jgi:hypothetical protein
MSKTQQDLGSGFKRWWEHQGQIPGRARLWITTAVVVLALLVVPLMVGGAADTVTSFLLVGAVGVSYLWLKHRRKLLGRASPMRGAWRAGFGVALGLIAVIGLSSMFTEASRASSPMGIISLTIGVIGFGVVALVIVALVIVIKRLAGSSASAGGAKATSGTIASATNDPALAQLLSVLSSPSALGQLFLNSGLAQRQIEERKAAPRRTAQYSNVDIAMDAVSLGKQLFGRKVQPGLFVDPNGNKYRVPQLLGTQNSNAGLLAWFDILPGFVTASYQKGAEAIGTALGLPRGITVGQTEEDVRNRHMRFHFRLSDPLAGVVPYDWNAPVTYTSIPFGVTDDGVPLTLGCLESNLILGGIPGGGKSGGLTTYITGLARLENVAIVGLDPKRVEQGMWAPRFSWIGKDLDVMTDGLRRLTDEMDRRYGQLEEGGLKKVPESWFPKMPLIAVVIDELAELVAMGISKEEKEGDTQRITHITRLVQKGRAAGIVIIMATQKPGGVTIPTYLRDLVALKAAYATTTRQMTDTILGDGMSSNGGLSHEIAANEKGVCYVVNETSRFPVKARTYWIKDADVEGIAERTSHLRVELPWMYEKVNSSESADAEEDDWAGDIFAD